MIKKFITWLVRKHILPEMDRQYAEELMLAEDEGIVIEFVADPQLEAKSSTKH